MRWTGVLSVLRSTTANMFASFCDGDAPVVSFWQMDLCRLLTGPLDQLSIASADLRLLIDCAVRPADTTDHAAGSGAGAAARITLQQPRHLRACAATHLAACDGGLLRRSLSWIQISQLRLHMMLRHASKLDEVRLVRNWQGDRSGSKPHCFICRRLACRRHWT